MPELPEVETIRRGLEPQITGASVQAVEVGDTKVFQYDPAESDAGLIGQKIQSLGRRGKYLILSLDRFYWIFHLGMTGQMTLRDPGRRDARRFLRHPVTGLQRATQHRPDRHTHLVVYLDHEKSLQFRDVRKFGKIHLLERSPGALEAFFAHLGPEPLSHSYRQEEFLRGLSARRTRIKSILLDQSFVAGIGNIYADEALFEAAIHPARRISTLRLYEKKRLYRAIPKVLGKGLFYGGTTLRDYLNSEGEAGGHQEELLVYGRSGLPCSRCSSMIEKTVVSQRGTHFCPSCQPRHHPRRLANEGSVLQAR